MATELHQKQRPVLTRHSKVGAAEANSIQFSSKKTKRIRPVAGKSVTGCLAPNKVGIKMVKTAAVFVHKLPVSAVTAKPWP